MAKRRSGNTLLRSAISLMVIGFGSVGLSFTDYQFILLSWANPFQPWIGLVIGLIGVGFIVVPLIASRTGGVRSVAPVQSFQQQNPGYPPQQQQYPQQQYSQQQFPQQQFAQQPQPGFNPQQQSYGAPQQHRPAQNFGQQPNYGPPQNYRPQP